MAERPVGVGVGEAVAQEVLTEEVLQYDTNCQNIVRSIQEHRVYIAAGPQIEKACETHNISHMTSGVLSP